MTHSTPAASSPVDRVALSGAKWKTTSVVTAKSAIAGTACGARSSSSRSLRSSAPTARRIIAYSAPIVGGGRPRRRAPAAPARPPRRPSARSASARPPAGSWLVTTRVRPRRAPMSGSTQLGRGRVEVGARLVEQQQLGVVQHGAARRRGAGPCRASRCARGRRRARVSADRVEQLLDARGGHAVQARVEAQVLARR